MKIKNIVIVGGGTAGWSTAHHFLSKTSERVKITVVSSKEIPVIGVGESTTGLFNDMIKNCHTLGDEKEFLKETESTFKLGIKHSDWHTVGQSFYSPIGDNYSNDFSYPNKDYDNIRIYHVAENLSYDNWLQSSLMKNNKLHIINNESIFDLNTKQTGNPVAYHLDTYKVGQYLNASL
jgi:tryptophan halogenase